MKFKKQYIRRKPEQPLEVWYDPLAPRPRLDPARLRVPQDPSGGMASIMGKWPGDETEEEIAEGLEWLS